MTLLSPPLLLLLLLFLLLLLSSSSSCPQRCECHAPRTPLLLLSVSCRGRRLLSVPDGIPSEVRILDLSSNRLRWVERSDFQSYPLLEELDLSENSISVLEPDSFSSLSALRVLSLRSNLLKLVPMGAFARLVNLTTLDLSQNRVVILLDFTFQDLRSLRGLEVGDNELVFMAQKAFLGLGGLQTLTIERCNLTSVSAQALSYLRGLTELRLRHLPSATALEDRNFARLGALRGLEISHWPLLHQISPHALQGLDLAWLHITHCSLRSVPSQALRWLGRNLASLDLSYNPITSLEPGAFRDLPRLREISLVGAGITTVRPLALGGLLGLRLLNLSSNGLATLEEGVFSPAPSSAPSGPAPATVALETLRLDGNPLACDCRLLWVLRSHRRRGNGGGASAGGGGGGGLGFDGRPPLCHAPSEVKGRDLGELANQNEELFACQRPKIRNRKLQKVSAREGQVVSFSCHAEGSPPPAVFWISPRRRRISSSSTSSSSSSQNSSSSSSSSQSSSSSPPPPRLSVLPGGTLRIGYARVSDSGTYICIASNAGGNDTYFATLVVTATEPSSPLGPPGNRSRYYGDDDDDDDLDDGDGPHGNDTRVQLRFTLDLTTILVSTAMGCIMFLGVVIFCFLLLFAWSRGRGQRKNNFGAEYSFRKEGGGGGGGGRST